MRLTTTCYRPGTGWADPLPAAEDDARTLVLTFGPAPLADDPRPLAELAAAFPRSTLIGCSTSGGILGDKLNDDGLVVAVARFAHTDLTAATAAVGEAADGTADGNADSFAAGRAVAARLASPGLRAVLVYADGLRVNGSDLVRGLNDGLAGLGHPVTVTGGMAADGERYRQTWTLGGDREGDRPGDFRGVPRAGRVVAVGLSGPHLRVGHGSAGGFDPFGPERRITRAAGRVVYEIDGQPALALYKRYLGDRAAGLPATALLFPLSMRSGPDSEHRLVRGVLSVDEPTQSLTLGGDVPQGWCGQLMRASVDRLVDGATAAATAVGAGPHDDAAGGAGRHAGGGTVGATLTIAVSCSGRRLVMGERTEEELEAVAALAPVGAGQVGFYSYGEISPCNGSDADPNANGGGAALHNQTMTLTRFAEAA